MKDTSALKDLIIACLDKEKAEDIVVIDLAGKADFAEYIIVASGLSGRHTLALSEKIVFELKHNGLSYINVEGQEGGNWILVDVMSVVVHLFKPEVREMYKIEQIWQPKRVASPSEQ